MSNRYTYIKSDAFTAGASLGNPAAILYLEPGKQLSKREMLDIAKAHKGFVSEMVYCTRSEAGIHLTYFSPECEVDFCGHGTIACMYSLIKATPELLAQETISIQTNKKGTLTVFNRVPDLDAVFVTAPKPEYIEKQLGRGSVAEALGITENVIDRTHPIELIDAGLRTLIVPLRDLKTEVSLYPDEYILKKFCLDHDIDIVLIFSKEVSDRKHIAHTRVFTPKFGSLEDPATGSGNSAFGYYMLKHALWDKADCVIEQGGSDRIFNDVHLTYKEDTVLFGGGATVRIEGVYLV